MKYIVLQYVKHSSKHALKIHLVRHTLVFVTNTFGSQHNTDTVRIKWSQHLVEPAAFSTNLAMEAENENKQFDSLK